MKKKTLNFSCNHNKNACCAYDISFFSKKNSHDNEMNTRIHKDYHYSLKGMHNNITISHSIFCILIECCISYNKILIIDIIDRRNVYAMPYANERERNKNAYAYSNVHHDM